MGLTVAPATPRGAHARRLLGRRGGRPSLETINLIQDDLAFWRALFTLYPILAVIGARSLMPPKSILILHIPVPWTMSPYYQTVELPWTVAVVGRFITLRSSRTA